MTKRDEQKVKPNGSSQNTVQGFVFGINLKGTEDVVMEGIKAFAQAMEKGGVTLALPPVRPTLTSGGKRAAAAAIDQDPEETVDETPEEPLVAENDEDEEAGGATSNGAKPTQRRVPRTPEVLSDIDFNTGKVGLKDFISQRNPTDNYERYAAIAVWYRDNQGLDEVNPDRIYTAYKFMDWIPPNNVAQVLRDLKSNPSKKWFDKGNGKGAYKVNIIGINKVAAGFGN
ncbi:MAG: hypothetical protein WAM56_17960 [Acidobacteriaceae bacterium]